METVRGATDPHAFGGSLGWIGAGVATLLVLVPILLGAREYLLYLGTMALIFGLLAESWSLPAQAGLISFGHAAFFGVGAYASALLTVRWQFSPWVALMGAGLLAGLFGLLTAEVAGDLAGPYFSLATLAVAEILRVVALHWTALTEGAWGLVGIPGLPRLELGWIPLSVGDRSTDYYAALLLLGLVCATQAWIRASPLGLAIRAIRQGEGRAAASGVDARRVKRIALGLSALFAGEAGALHAHIFHWVDPASVFSPSLSVLPLIMAMLGGSGFLLGPVLGAVMLYLGNELVLQPLAPGAHLLLYGGAVVIVILALPYGILGWIEARIGLRPRGAPGPEGGRRAAV